MGTALTFGDVVRYSGKDLVFLGATDEIIYLAPMPNLEISRKVVDMANQRLGNTPGSERLSGNQLYCFIQLTTQEFKERIANYGVRKDDQSEYIIEDFMDKIGELNLVDKKCLQKEILDDNAPEGLKNVIKAVKLD